MPRPNLHKGAYIHKTKRGIIGINYKEALLYQFDKKFGLQINDFIYHYNPTNKSIQCRYVADYGKYDLGKESASKVSIMNLFFETNKFLLFSVIFPKSAFPERHSCYLFSVFVYDKESEEIKALKVDPIFGVDRASFGGNNGYVGLKNDLVMEEPHSFHAI